MYIWFTTLSRAGIIGLCWSDRMPHTLPDLGDQTSTVFLKFYGMPNLWSFKQMWEKRTRESTGMVFINWIVSRKSVLCLDCSRYWVRSSSFWEEKGFEWLLRHDVIPKFQQEASVNRQTLQAATLVHHSVIMCILVETRCGLMPWSVRWFFVADFTASQTFVYQQVKPSYQWNFLDQNCIYQRQNNLHKFYARSGWFVWQEGVSKKLLEFVELKTIEKGLQMFRLRPQAVGKWRKRPNHWFTKQGNNRQSKICVQNTLMRTKFAKFKNLNTQNSRNR